MSPQDTPLMQAHDELEKRLIELEIKASYADDLLDQLNQTLYRQQQLIEALTREVQALRQQQAVQGTSGLSSPVQERPPHY